MDFHFGEDVHFCRPEIEFDEKWGISTQSEITMSHFTIPAVFGMKFSTAEPRHRRLPDSYVARGEFVNSFGSLRRNRFDE